MFECLLALHVDITLHLVLFVLSSFPHSCCLLLHFVRMFQQFVVVDDIDIDKP